MSFNDKIPGIFRDVTDASLRYGIPSGTSSNVLHIHWTQETSAVRECLMCVLVSDVMANQ